jgi:UBA/TS-N domain.
MNANLNQIDELRRRANVSYEEAKDALERCNGDMVEALILLEKMNRVKQGSCNNSENGFTTTVKKLLKEGQETKFVVRKNDNTIINVPVNALVLTTVVMPPLTIIGGLAALFTNHRMRFEKPDGRDMEINNMFDKMADSAERVKEQMNKCQ